jgi:flagellar biosynthesis component FlhA
MNHVADEAGERAVMAVGEVLVLLGVIAGASVLVILLFTLALLIDCRSR